MTELGWSDQIAKIRRDAITGVVSDYDKWIDNEDAVVDAIFALPIEQARDRVIEAARAWRAFRQGGSYDLNAAVAELDALEAQGCPNDPVGEGTHFFDNPGRCMYCGARDPLTPDEVGCVCPTCGEEIDADDDGCPDEEQ